MNDSEYNKAFSAKFIGMTGGISAKKMDSFSSLLDAIRKLKKQHNAVVLSH